MSVSAAARHSPAAAGGVPALRGLKIAAVLGALLGVCCLVLIIAIGSMLGFAPGLFGDAAAASPSATAVADIPPRYLTLYERAGARYGIDWAILAGIGKVECDHGRDPDPSCTREGAVNSAGAGGPMQFLASTFAQYGVSARGGGRPDRWSPADAIFSAANYLRASGAPGDYEKAIFAYNHASWYVQEVEHWASVYRGAASASGSAEPPAEETPLSGIAGAGVETFMETWPQVGPVEMVSGARALLSPNDGHVALVPAQAPTAVQAMAIAGNELQDLPYGPAGHPDPRGASNEDCSSTVNYVLYRSGVRSIDEIVRENPLAQNYVTWGDPGPGRWVTIYATDTPTPHVFIVIAGLRLDTSHNGTDTGPNRLEDGPRWRILDHIPTWANWSVRHPPGL
jgi:Transglycosylase SLT domain